MSLEYYRANNMHINNTVFTQNNARGTGVYEAVFTMKVAPGKKGRG